MVKSYLKMAALSYSYTARLLLLKTKKTISCIQRNPAKGGIIGCALLSTPISSQSLSSNACERIKYSILRTKLGRFFGIILCGVTATLSKINLWFFVRRHPEWNCEYCCVFCKYWRHCYYEMEIILKWDSFNE